MSSTATLSEQGLVSENSLLSSLQKEFPDIDFLGIEEKDGELVIFLWADISEDQRSEILAFFSEREEGMPQIDFRINTVLKSTDKERRELEKKVKLYVLGLIEELEIPRENIASVRIRWNTVARLLRTFGIPATWKVVKIRWKFTDKESEHLTHEIGNEFDLSAHTFPTRLPEQARLEKEATETIRKPRKNKITPVSS